MKILDKYRVVEVLDEYTIQRKKQNYASESDILKTQTRLAKIINQEGVKNE